MGSLSFLLIVHLLAAPVRLKTSTRSRRFYQRASTSDASSPCSQSGRQNGTDFPADCFIAAGKVELARRGRAISHLPFCAARLSCRQESWRWRIFQHKGLGPLLTRRRKPGTGFVSQDCRLAHAGGRTLHVPVAPDAPARPAGILSPTKSGPVRLDARGDLVFVLSRASASHIGAWFPKASAR